MLRRAVWRGTPPLTRRRRRVAAERLFVIGDSAAYLQPFTGEGMSWAMQSAVLVVPVALKAVDRWSAGLAWSWERRYRRFFGRQQRVCRAVGVLLRYRFLARVVTAIVAKAPWLARPWLNRINLPSREVRAYPGT
jgi:flavin-dependent dehydrogenase